MLKDMLKELAAANPRRAGPVLKRLHAAAATAGDGGHGAGAAAQQAGDLQQQAQQAERADEGDSLGDEEELSGLSREVESLRSALQRKEREVALLVGMLRKQGAADPQAAAAAAAAAEEQGRAGAGLGGARPGSSAGVAQQQQQLQPQPQPEAGTVPPLNDDMLVDQNRAVSERRVASCLMLVWLSKPAPWNARRRRRRSSSRLATQTHALALAPLTLTAAPAAPAAAV